jgi:hypothetical protein
MSRQRKPCHLLACGRTVKMAFFSPPAPVLQEPVVSRLTAGGMKG